MSETDFTITDNSNDTLRIEPFNEHGSALRVWMDRNTRAQPFVRVTAEQAPALALAILVAAGFTNTGIDWESEAINSLTEVIRQRAKEAAEEAKKAEAEAARDKRRDELANVFAPRGPGLGKNWYGNVSHGLRAAIDLIIELEAASNV